MPYRIYTLFHVFLANKFWTLIHCHKNYNSQAMYHLTTAMEHIQLAFTSLESETGRYDSQLAYRKDISTLVPEALMLIFSRLFCIMTDI